MFFAHIITRMKWNKRMRRIMLSPARGSGEHINVKAFIFATQNTIRAKNPYLRCTTAGYQHVIYDLWTMNIEYKYIKYWDMLAFDLTPFSINTFKTLFKENFQRRRGRERESVCESLNHFVSWCEFRKFYFLFSGFAIRSNGFRVFE